MASLSATVLADADVVAQRGNLTGIAYGAGAGALWGLVFLAPEVAGAFSPLQLSIGRYLCYGALAAVLIAPRWRLLTAFLSWRQWLTLSWLAFFGNTFYYVLLSTAVQTGGIAMTSLVMGFLPVAVTIIGSRDRGAVPLARLLPSLLFCAAGAVCIGWQAFTGSGDASSARQLIGLFCAIAAMASWSAYAVGNARNLSRLEHVSAHDWNLLTGLVTGAQSVMLIPLALVLESTHHGAGDWTRFAAVSAGVAILASVVGNSLWNQMSRLLPLTLVGQMILFETVFALIYAFLWEHRAPAPLELAALALVVTSVLSCLAAHRTPVALDAHA
jgi:drug/metabolite transporter (DMT)-like permease